jgi:hypothetical protein
MACLKLSISPLAVGHAGSHEPSLDCSLYLTVYNLKHDCDDKVQDKSSTLLQNVVFILELDLHYFLAYAKSVLSGSC